MWFIYAGLDFNLTVLNFISTACVGFLVIPFDHVFSIVVPKELNFFRRMFRAVQHVHFTPGRRVACTEFVISCTHSSANLLLLVRKVTLPPFFNYHAWYGWKMPGGYFDNVFPLCKLVLQFSCVQKTCRYP